MRWRSWLTQCATSQKVTGVRFPMVSLEFFIDIILPVHYGPGVDSASNRNEYREYFSGGCRDGRCVGLTVLSHSCAESLEIWKFQLPGTLRVCSGLHKFCFVLI